MTMSVDSAGPRSDRATVTQPALEARDLVRMFARRRVLDGVSLTLRSGECLALFGPNGAGKTTLLRVLAGLLKPASGTVRVGPEGVLLGSDAAARSYVGIVSHQSTLYSALTAMENVAFSAKLYGVSDAGAAAESALRRLRVLDRANVPVRTLSRGMQQRVSIARALVHRPHVLLMDEPYSGLDESGAAALTRTLVALRAERTALLLVTHNLDEGLALASHAAIMRDGRLVRHERRDSVEPARYAAEYRELVSAAG